MQTPALSFGRSQLENFTVPEGDRGEQLIAHVILSIIACQLDALASAKKFIALAHADAVKLSGSGLTYRPSRPSKFARFTFTVEGETESLLLSVINNVLVMPPISPSEIARIVLRESVSLGDMEVAHFGLRLRPRKLAIVLEQMQQKTCAEEFTEAARSILMESLRYEMPITEPLDRASDHFWLARGLIGNGNYPLAAISLKKADSALDLHMRTTAIKGHPGIVRTMREQIAAMTNELTRGR